MNFEEMQRRWQTQFPPSSGIQPDSMNAKLLARILRNQRGYVRTLVLMALRDVLGAGLIIASLIFITEIGPHSSPAVVRACGRGLGIWMAVLFVLQGIIVRRMPGMLAIRAERSLLSLGSRVHRDAGRFRLQIVWSEVKQVVISALLVAFVIVLTDRTGLQGPLRWIAITFVAIPALAVLVRRIFTRPMSSVPGQNLSETLAFAVRQTEGQMRRMKRQWFPPLHLVGIFLSLKPVWLNHGTVQPVGWVVLAIFTALWVFVLLANRWVIRRLLRPRLAELNQLQAGLTPPDPSEQ